MPEESIDLGAAEMTWNGHEVLGSHCQVSRRVRDGALFAEIWVPVSTDCDNVQTYQYIGPVRLPSHG